MDNNHVTRDETYPAPGCQHASQRASPCRRGTLRRVMDGHQRLNSDIQLGSVDRGPRTRKGFRDFSLI